MTGFYKIETLVVKGFKAFQHHIEHINSTQKNLNNISPGSLMFKYFQNIYMD